MAIDFDTDKIILLFAKDAIAARLTASALALSDNAVLQVNEENMSIEDKYLHLMDGLEEFKDGDKWDVNLELGCIQFFGVTDIHKAAFDFTVTNYQSRTFNPIVSNTIDANLYFFLVVYNSSQLPTVLECWPNAKMITFLGDGFRRTEELPTSITDRPNISNWDPNWDEDNTLFSTRIKTLAAELGIVNIDPTLVTDFHRLWIKKSRGKDV